MDGARIDGQSETSILVSTSRRTKESLRAQAQHDGVPMAALVRRYIEMGLNPRAPHVPTGDERVAHRERGCHLAEEVGHHGIYELLDAIDDEILDGIKYGEFMQDGSADVYRQLQMMLRPLLTFTVRHDL
jgi:hypothetical protein